MILIITTIILAITTTILTFETIKLSYQKKELVACLYIARNELKFGKAKISGAKKRVTNLLIKNEESISPEDLYKKLDAIKNMDIEVYKTAVLALSSEKILKKVKVNVGLGE